MHFVDTHTHLFSSQFEDDIDEVIRRAVEAGVLQMFLPNIDLQTIEPMIELSRKYPQNCFPMVGLHPCDVKQDYQDDLNQIESWIEQNRSQCYGIGETGLDYYWDKEFIAEQKISLERHIEWAKRFDLPLILHTRDSFHDNLSIVREHQDGRLKGIFHCFTGNLEEAKQVVEAGFLLGIGGVITFKNSGAELREVLRQIDLESLVLETDSPYLTPAPNRGKRNESSYIPVIAEKLSEVKDVSLEHIAQVTTQNALDLFRLDANQ